MPGITLPKVLRISNLIVGGLQIGLLVVLALPAFIVGLMLSGRSHLAGEGLGAFYLLMFVLACVRVKAASGLGTRTSARWVLLVTVLLHAALASTVEVFLRRAEMHALMVVPGVFLLVDLVTAAGLVSPAFVRAKA